MKQIREANSADISLIVNLAHEIWWPTYQDFISKEQISLMLNEMYNETALKEQMENGHQFLLLSVNNMDTGFASFSATENPEIYKLHKLYLKKEIQGIGAGKFFLSGIENIVKGLGTKILELNVNRNNPAKSFYEKMGYTVYAEVDIPYYNFVLDDYIMRKKIQL